MAGANSSQVARLRVSTGTSASCSESGTVCSQLCAAGDVQLYGEPMALECKSTVMAYCPERTPSSAAIVHSVGEGVVGKANRVPQWITWRLWRSSTVAIAETGR